MNDKKKMVRKILFFCTSMALIFVLYFFSMRAITIKADIEYFKEKLDVDNCIALEVESMANRDNNVVLNGWIVRTDSENRRVNVVLREVDSKALIVGRTSLCEKADVQDYFGASVDFGKCGFETELKADEIEQDKVYEILVSIRYTYVNQVNGKSITNEQVKRVSSRQYLYNGELYFYNPLEYYVPEVTDSKFQNAIVHGEVCAFDNDKEVWIYEYDKKLYIIANRGVVGGLERHPKVPVFIYTSNKDALPDGERIEGIGRKDFAITQEHYDNMDGEYVLLTIDFEEVFYPVTCIRTGFYSGEGDNKEWTWMAEFRTKFRNGR